jgi:endonuclease-3
MDDRITEPEPPRHQETKRRIQQILAALERLYGRPELRPHGDLLGELTGAILSQNTSDVNSYRAYESLRRAFPDWRQVIQARDEEIAKAIRVAGLSMQKAPAIRAAVTALMVDGYEQRVRWLRTAPLDEARDWLQSLPGVGPKTAACVLLFALGRPALPVDTHVFRVSQRLGLLPPGVSPTAAHGLLEAIVPSTDRFRFHVLLIRHGRAICQSRRPACGRCVLVPWCEYAGKRTTGDPEQQFPTTHAVALARPAAHVSARCDASGTPQNPISVGGSNRDESERET